VLHRSPGSGAFQHSLRQLPGCQLATFSKWWPKLAICLERDDSAACHMPHQRASPIANGPVNFHRCFKGLRLPHAARAEPERPVTRSSYPRLLRASPEIIAGRAEADRHTKINNPHGRCHTKWKTWVLTALGNIDQARDQRVTGCTTVAEPQVQHVRSRLNPHFRLRPHQLSTPPTLCRCISAHTASLHTHAQFYVTRGQAIRCCRTFCLAQGIHSTCLAIRACEITHGLLTCRDV
jgi:hypothetical protein